MDGWDAAFVVAAGYISVVTLARLMRQHRDKLVADMRREVEEEKQRQLVEQRRIETERRIRERKERRAKAS